MSDELVEGEGVRVWVEFRDAETERLEDPVEPVTVTIDPPEGDPMPGSRVIAATRKSRGVYYADTTGDIPGWWSWRGESSPPGPGVAEGTFEVKPSRMR